MNQKQSQALSSFEYFLSDLLGPGSAHQVLAQRELEKLKSALATEPVKVAVDQKTEK
jgi:hypothetical protein